MAIQSTAIGTSNTDIYISNGNTAVTCIWVCNTVTYNPLDPTAGTTYLDVHFVKNGSGVSNVNQIINQLPVPAGETVIFDTEKIILDNGDKIVANADTVNLSATISVISV